MQLEKSRNKIQKLTRVSNIKMSDPTSEDVNEDMEMIRKCREARTYISHSLNRKEVLLADLEASLRLLERLGANGKRMLVIEQRIIREASRKPWFRRFVTNAKSGVI